MLRHTISNPLVRWLAAAMLGLSASSASAAQKPKSIKRANDEPTYVRYTPHQGQMGKQTGPQNDRIIKIVNRQQDPFAPPTHKIKKIPRGPPSPPAPPTPRHLHTPGRECGAAPHCQAGRRFHAGLHIVHADIPRSRQTELSTRISINQMILIRVPRV